MEPEFSHPFLWNHILTTTTIVSFILLLHRDHVEMDNPWFGR